MSNFCYRDSNKNIISATLIGGHASFRQAPETPDPFAQEVWTVKLYLVLNWTYYCYSNMLEIIGCAHCK